MTITWDNPQHLFVIVYLINLQLLFVKVLITNFSLGFWKAKENKIKNPEDLKFMPSKYKDQVQEDQPTEIKENEQISKTERTSNIQRNEFENLIPFIFSSTSFIVAFLIIPHDSNVAKWIHFSGGTVCMFGFTINRYIYSLVYFLGLQPWRSLFFAGAGLCNIILLLWSFVCIFV
jgi:uncharacterized MAPEG superfamily protein